MRPRYMFLKLMASKLHGIANVRSTKKNAWCQPVTHGGGSVLLWVCMSAAGLRELHFIDGIMNLQMYCSILKEKYFYITVIHNTHLRPLLNF
ncbi:unnamed protein product [Staurois parvus]|uniref:Uncharacterized protein n=1 Tax=Staurois parvus TaxID=386267 RepID=A0ABN9GJN4_9NEOB|nr:unnamed protein product [Staurois parvus]